MQFDRRIVLSFRKTTGALLASLCLFTGSLKAGDREDGEQAAKNYVERKEQIPNSAFEKASDAYLEGYIQALVDMHYYEYEVIVVVHDHKVYLGNLPHNALISNSIIAFVQDVPSVTSVEVKNHNTFEEMAMKLKNREQPRVEGIWFPQMTVLFPPLIADPREPMYYVAYRWGDKVVGRKSVSVALGDEFPIFRWRDVFRWHGDLQIGISAGVWALFNFKNVDHSRGDACELFNTDYLLGIPLSYAIDRWAFRLMPYHISSHLGDEFLCNRKITERINPSFEALEFVAQYQVNRQVRLYAGPGIVLHSDESFSMKTFYILYGAEIRAFGSKLSYHRLYGTPFLAIFINNWQVRSWGFDSTIKAGYEFSKLQGIGRKMRLFAAYHNGYSWEGMFFKKHVQYGEFGLSWGF
jgi:hypothetical protein